MIGTVLLYRQQMLTVQTVSQPAILKAQLKMMRTLVMAAIMKHSESTACMPGRGRLFVRHQCTGCMWQVACSHILQTHELYVLRPPLVHPTGYSKGFILQPVEKE